MSRLRTDRKEIKRQELLTASHQDSLAGKRSPCKCLHHFFERTVDVRPRAPAVMIGGEVTTYAELEARANRLAHHLLRLGIGPGSRVGLLLERSLHTYVSLLAILKSGGTFVPLDTSFPSQRLAFIAEDASLNLVLTTRAFEGATAQLTCHALFLDSAASIAREPVNRPRVVPGDNDLCYIIYTSGTTGRPKGVAITQASICNFLRVSTPIYKVAAGDRVYQGMTLAFDFSIEEIWPTFAAGATLVPGPLDHCRLGAGLTDFLIEQRITVLCCVPTLLATIERDVPTLRTLLVGGEACPANLVQRWSRPGRRMLNTYGPTETTVTATWTELLPNKPVTIGRPLPSYTVHLLDERLEPVAAGASGEICIGGPGVAARYINRPELTAKCFVPNPLEERGGRLYRTGDLGRLVCGGEIEFLGRIDGQVKIRGYRVELSEIEAVLREDPEVANATVTMWHEGTFQELIAYVSVRTSAPCGLSQASASKLRLRLHESLRRRLPAYMVPAFIEILDSLPMLPSGKTDRSRLPAHVSARLTVDNAAGDVQPATPLETEIAAAWGRVFGLPGVSVEADFFLDLGGHSLFAAMAISDLRKNSALRSLSMADLYTHPTIRGLARHLQGHLSQNRVQVPQRARRPATLGVVACGLTQVAFLYLLILVMGAPVALLLTAPPQGHFRNLGSIYVCAVGITMLTTLLLPIIGKWLVLGKARPGRYPLWGWFYCRWWLARKLLALAPLNYLAGSPLLAIYLRLLGARIGKGCHLGSAKLHMPDLLDIGSGTSIGYGADLEPFIVEGGWLHLAPIRVGAGAFIGTNAVVMLGAVVGEGAAVSEQSLVARDQIIPPGETWTGSPSRQTIFDTQLRKMADLQAVVHWSPVLWTGFVAGLLLLLVLPWLLLVPGLLLVYLAAEIDWWQGLAVLPLAGLIYVLTTCLVVAAGKRVVYPKARRGLVPLCSGFGLRKWFADKLMLLSLTTTNSLYATLYTSPWLRLLGAKVGCRAEVSTVSNIDPDLLVVGHESFIADLAVVGAARYHRGTIALGITELGARCFVGNAALVPSDTQLPNRSLIGVQSVAPAAPLKAATSWLGSPAMFLPRRQLSEQFDEALTYRPASRLVICRLAVEFFRVVTPAAFMYAACLGGTFVLEWLRNLPLVHMVAALPVLYFGMAFVATGLVAILKWLVVGRYRRRVEPMWSFFVWRTEFITALYENVAVPWLLHWLTGTPLMGPLLRLFGARIGPRVYLDTTYVTEFDLVRVGADAMVGGFTSLQTHLFEDRVMKMSTVTVGPGCSVGPRSVVLYDAELAAGVCLEPLSLAMKGEMLPTETRWRGIPARLVEG
jgi:non-ribosomal peptide synthetase-like protein